jgi:subtilisin
LSQELCSALLSSGPRRPRNAAVTRYTDRHLVLLSRQTGRLAARILHRALGLRLIGSSELDGPGLHTEIAAGEALLLEGLSLALVHSDPQQMRWFERRRKHGLGLILPERTVRASGVIGRVPAAHAFRTHAPAGMRAGESFADSPRATWGLQASGAVTSRYSGRGIRIAILDTGIDLEHPDFRRRQVVAQSFVAGRSTQDDNGHGTFCAGVACGPLRPQEGPRYGVAFASELYVGRVLDEYADGSDGDVLAGIDWAVRSKCAVISLSLGSPVGMGESYPRVYEEVAARALAAGSLLMAPSGNTSQRPAEIAPVEHPANCPSVCVIGAVDQRCSVASFSNGGLNLRGGAVDLAAPGVAIHSAAPRPTLYQLGSGTSLATPHAAGIAALHAEADPQARGAALRARLQAAARVLPALRRDVGAGLVRSP